MSVAAAFVYGGGTIAASSVPPEVSGYYVGGGTADVTTGATVAAGADGVAPYTYAWVQTGTSPYTWTIGSPAAATTTFTAHALPEGVSDTTAFRVTVTDAAGGTGTADVSATAINNTFIFTGPFF